MGFFSSLFGINKTKVDLIEWIQEGAIIVDVRTPGEYQAAHGKNAVNIPLNTLQTKVNSIKQQQKKVILVCKSGGRAGMAKRILNKEGVECHNAGAWQNLN